MGFLLVRLCSGLIVVLAALKPLMRQGEAKTGVLKSEKFAKCCRCSALLCTGFFRLSQGLEETAIKRLLLGVAFSANAGSILLPISSTTTLITLSCATDNPLGGACKPMCQGKRKSLDVHLPPEEIHTVSYISCWRCQVA